MNSDLKKSGNIREQMNTDEKDVGFAARKKLATKQNKTSA